MSWIERAKNDLIIVTGDGKEWRPLYLNPSKGKDYNIAQFDFPNVKGSRVERGQPQGRKFPLEFYFTGEFCIEESENFEVSADDPRPWNISHPKYGEILAQPVSINFGDEKENACKITCTVIETIPDDNPRGTTDPVDRISNDHALVLGQLASQFGNLDIDVSGIQLFQESANEVYNNAVPKIKLTVDAVEFSNRFQRAQAAFLQATAKPIEAAQAMNEMISYVAEFKIESAISIVGDFSINATKNRIQAFIDCYDSLIESKDTIDNRIGKIIFENNTGSIIASMCLASATPEEGDYSNANDVLTIMESILDTFNDLIEQLDSLQTDNGGAPDSYIPDFASLAALSNLVTFTVANLYNIALNSKQERSIICEKDTNLILLAHRFYGLTVDDATIVTLMRTNQIGLSGILKIMKGTRIVYYV